MTDDLVERVALALECADVRDAGYCDLARAALAVLRPALRAEALEEAAKVADQRVDELVALREEAPLGCGSLSWSDYNARICEVEDIAAAIRALIPKEEV